MSRVDLVGTSCTSSHAASGWQPSRPYEIIAPLGTGGMGVVYRAHDPRLERDVAIRLLPEIADISPEARTQLLREARTAASLNHPYICSVHDVGVGDSDGLPFIAMELVEGGAMRSAHPGAGGQRLREPQCL